MFLSLSRTVITKEIIANIPSTIKTLNLSILKSSYTDWINDIIKMPSITTLFIGDNYISLENIKILSLTTTITDLRIPSVHIGDKGAKYLALNHTIIQLDISNNSIGLKGAKYLARNTSLRMLNIRCNDIGDEGRKELLGNIIIEFLLMDDYYKQDRGRINRHNKRVKGERLMSKWQ